MKLSLNREYAVRHLGVAALMAALCAWFVYDGAVAYPAMSDVDFKEKVLHNLDYPDFPKKRKETTDRQFQFAAIAGLAALVIAGGVWRAKRRIVEWDDSAMTGPATGGRPLAFSDVADVDRSRWEKKGILVVHAKDGRKVTLDAWHHAGVKELAERLPSGPAAT